MKTNFMKYRFGNLVMKQNRHVTLMKMTIAAIAVVGLEACDKISVRGLGNGDNSNGVTTNSVDTTGTPTPTPAPSMTPDPSPTPAPSASPTPNPTSTPSMSPTPTPYPTASPSPTVSPTPTASPTPRMSPTPTPTASPTPRMSPTPTPTASPTPKVSPTPTPKVSPTPSPSPTPIVCHGGGHAVPPEFGLQGTIYSGSQAISGSVDSMISKGTQIGASLFMNEVNNPTVNFTDGFMTTNGQKIVDPNGNVLIEWFALDLQSRLTLSDSDHEGDYQIAVISDDGSILSATQNGINGVVVNSDGLHATNMQCSKSTIHLNRGDTIPIELKYYQGPRYAIALTMLWRKVDKNSNVTDPLCGGAGSDTAFWDPSQTPSAPNDNYKALMSRGWTVLGAKNFLLKDGQTNPCVNPGQESKEESCHDMDRARRLILALQDELILETPPTDEIGRALKGSEEAKLEIDRALKFASCPKVKKSDTAAEVLTIRRDSNLKLLNTHPHIFYSLRATEESESSLRNARPIFDGHREKAMDIMKNVESLIHVDVDKRPDCH